jgi:hypothetical protein
VVVVQQQLQDFFSSSVQGAALRGVELHAAEKLSLSM